ncbi:MAG: hypothetical protein K2N94_14125 [Lachnospiraceae bacterium]|nr:hypothetical protein [Lachnospiraceae bacterium]
MKQRKRIIVGVFLFLCVGMALFWPGRRADAASPSLKVTKIDYEAETITIESDAGDVRLFYSDGKMKNWECAYGTFSSKQYVLDISWVSKTKDYTLSLKGDKSETPISVVLPKQQSNFKVTFDCLKQQLVFTNAGSGTIYWRKADSTTWNLIGTATASQQATIDIFQRFYAKGVALCFRVGQVEGVLSNGKLSPGSRPSKEVKLKITKQATEPKISVNAVKLIASTTDKMEYQLDGTGEWKACTKNGLKLDEIAAAALSKEAAKDVTIAVRVAATEKKLASAARQIFVKAREAAPGNVEHKFKSYTTLTVSVADKKDEEGNVIEKAASKSNPYEYTIVKEGEEFKDDASWTAITAAEIVLTAEKAPTGSSVYVRKKSAYYSDGVFRFASEPVSFKVDKYPEETKAVLVEEDKPTDSASLDKDGKVALVKAEGSEATGLEFKLVISDLCADTDIDKISCGNTELEFTSEKTDNIVHVKITSTAKYEAAVKKRDEACPVKITLKNGEIVNKAVTLEILGSSSISKGAVFEVYNNTSKDPYSFVVIPGKKLHKESDGSRPAKTIQKISLLEQEINKTDYEVKVNSKDGSYEVTIYSSGLQGFFENEKMELDKEYPLTITMEDGEELKDSIKIRFTQEATIPGAPYIITTTVSSPLTQNYVIGITCKKSGVYVSSMTWNGIDIKGPSSSGDGKINAELDYKKLNELTLSAGKTEESYPVIITLSDGAMIEEGLTLVLQQ